RRGHARSPTRRVGTRRAGLSGRTRRHAWARLTSRDWQVRLPLRPAIRDDRRVHDAAATQVAPVNREIDPRSGGRTGPRSGSGRLGAAFPSSVPDRSPRVASNTSKTARASVRAGQAGAAAGALSVLGEFKYLIPLNHGKNAYVRNLTNGKTLH